MAAPTKRREMFWFQHLEKGMDQSVDTNRGGSENIKNAILDQRGNMVVRLGSDLFGTSLGANQGYGLFSHSSATKTGVDSAALYAVTDRDLNMYRVGDSSWSSYDDDIFTASKRVDGIDFLGRSYVNEEGGGLATSWLVGNLGTPALTGVTAGPKGNLLAVNKNILAVGSLTDERIYYTDAYSDRFFTPLGAAKASTATARANVDEDGANYVAITTDLFPADIEGGVIYNSTDDEYANVLDWVHGDNTTSTNAAVYTDGKQAVSGWNNDTLYVMKNVFRLDADCTGQIGYQGKFISFDADKMYVWDPTSNTSREWPGFGCINYRTLKIVNGLLFGVSKDGIWMMAGVESKPKNIMEKIQDKVNGYGMWDLINKANWSEVCAGVQEDRGKYWLSVGTLSTLSGAPLTAQSKVIIVLDIMTGQWTWRQYQDQMVAFASHTHGGITNLYGLGKADAAIWKFDTGTTDDNAAGAAQAISYEIRTPHEETFEHPYVSRAEQYFVKYTATAAVTVQESVNRGSYATIGTLPVASSVAIQDVTAGANKEGYSHSLKFTGTGAFSLEAWGVLAYRLAPRTGIPAV